MFKGGEAKFEAALEKYCKTKITTIQLDNTTLPLDGQRVTWQTIDDINAGTWKEGEYLAHDGLFMTDDNTDDFNFFVHHWKPL